MNEQKYKKVVSGLQHTGYINQYERWDALLLLEEYKNKLDKTLGVLQYELQFQTGGCYHRLSNLFDYLQNGGGENERN